MAVISIKQVLKALDPGDTAWYLWKSWTDHISTLLRVGAWNLGEEETRKRRVVNFLSYAEVKSQFIQIKGAAAVPGHVQDSGA
jgi:hypothetical protein